VSSGRWPMARWQPRRSPATGQGTNYHA
jgi:hypothetical protein